MRIAADGLHINYQLAGPESAPVVVLSHSLGSSGVMWEHQMPELVSAFRVLRFDTRGHGGTDSPGGPYSLDQLADDAIALLDVLEIEHVNWVGLSMGGMIGQNLGLRFPERLRSLALCDTTSEVTPELRPMWDERIAMAEKQGMEPLCEPTMERWFTGPFLENNPPDVRTIRGQFLATPTSGFVGCCQAIRELDYRNRLPGVALPTCVIVGAEDPATPPAAAEVIHQQISGSTLVVIDNAAHLSNVEQPQVFNTALLDFLNGV